jgi:hypothetical protein
MSETTRTEGREPTIDELRAFREQVREAHEDLTWTEQRLMRGVVEEPERDALVLEWGASGVEDLIRQVGWRAQRLREDEERLVERVGGAFDPIACLDTLTAAIDGDEPPTRYQMRDELVYVVRELRRSGSPTRVA